MAFWPGFCLKYSSLFILILFLIPIPLQNGRSVFRNIISRKDIAFNDPFPGVIQPIVPMIKRSLVLVAALWLLNSVHLSGQPGFSFPSFNNTDTGQYLDFPVGVVNFDSVFSIQFVVKWDPQVLEFQAVEHLVNPLNIVDSLCFNVAEAPAGLIRFRWYSASYKTLADNVAIFKLKMKVVGPDGSSTLVRFTEQLPTTYFEVVRGPGNQFFNQNTALLTNGTVTVGTVSNNDISKEAQQMQVAPNPFVYSTTIRVTTEKEQLSRLYITDLSGKICHEEKKYLNYGITGIEIANTQLRGKGMYFVHLVTEDAHLVQPIVYQ